MTALREVRIVMIDNYPCQDKDIKRDAVNFQLKAIVDCIPSTARILFPDDAGCRRGEDWNLVLNPEIGYIRL